MLCRGGDSGYEPTKWPHVGCQGVVGTVVIWRQRCEQGDFCVQMSGF